ncbi:MAG: UDP-N-acetylmuramate dehydrogenase [Xanthomonadales bacterium]|jgi:UDP-N-acetylmuramate dehydrogenase|nr:UDP-N-acetylmuramate dehydrogenase [Xanthomonadales bacterium]
MNALRIEREVELRARNTFRLPARAECFVELDDPAGLESLRQQFPQGPTLVLGEGSNLLLTGDVPGLTLAPRFSGRELLVEADRFRVRLMAGERWHAAVMWTLEQGVGGLENLALIWGHCGAAPIQNIGAYGVELERFIDTVEVYDWQRGRVLRLRHADCAFGYRDSCFKRWPGAFVVLAIELCLPRRWTPVLGYAGLDARLITLFAGQPPTPARIAEAVMSLRREKLPDPHAMPNAGSFFHNPIVDAGLALALLREWPGLPNWPQSDGRVKLGAAWLIEQAACKGLSVGDAAVSSQHALVLVNRGRAVGAEVLGLMQEVQARVAARFGVQLSPEPCLLPCRSAAATLGT